MDGDEGAGDDARGGEGRGQIDGCGGRTQGGEGGPVGQSVREGEGGEDEAVAVEDGVEGEGAEGVAGLACGG